MKKHAAHKLAAPCLVFLCLTMLGGCGTEESVRRSTPENSPPPAGPPYYSALDGYGDWIEAPGLGYAWRPYVTPDWEPYAYGNWVWTDRGWLWVGYEPFEWVVYHYGFWDDLPRVGWVWIPGDEWSPARVRWRSSDEFVSWAPLPPPGIAAPPLPQDDAWMTVPVRSFTRDNVGGYRTRDEVGRTTGRTREGNDRPPDVGLISRSAPGTVPTIPLQTERITEGRRRLERVKLPPSEENRIGSNRPQVEERYLRRRTGDGGTGARQGGVQATPAPAPVAPSLPPATRTPRTQPTPAPTPPAAPVPAPVQQQPAPKAPPPPAPPTSTSPPPSRPARTAGEGTGNGKQRQPAKTRQPRDQKAESKKKEKTGGEDKGKGETKDVGRTRDDGREPRTPASK